MSNTIKIGNLNISSFKVGSGDCAIYLGTVKVYPQDSPTPTAVKFSATYTGGATYSAECDGSSELTTATTKPSGYVASAMTSAVIGDCVTSIGGDAFYMCFGLTGITIPSGITSIGMYAFGSCGSLTGVTCLATTPPALEYGAFNGTNDCPIYVPCNSVDAYKAANRWDSYSSRIQAIPNSCVYDGKLRLTYYGGSTYEVPADGNTTLTRAEVTGGTMDKLYIVSAEIGSAVTNVGNYAFSACTNLSSVTFADTVTVIGYHGFSDCSGLTSVVIPDSVTLIDSGVFNNCSNLSSITIPDSVTSIGEYVFNGCKSLSSITIPNSVTNISKGLFCFCSGLTSVTIGNSVTSIGHESFRRCMALTGITLPDSVTSIDAVAFQNCSGLTEITIPSGVTSIGDGAFNECISLTGITCNAVTPPTLGGDAVFEYTNNCPIYVPFISVSTYQAAKYWSSYSSRLQKIPT